MGSRLRLACFCALLASACGDSDSTFDSGTLLDSAVVIDATSVDSMVNDAAAMFPETGPLVGTVHVYERSGPLTDGCGQGGNRGDIQGGFTSATMTNYHVETINDGVCRLREYRVGNCKACVSGFCVFPDECRPFSPRASAGTITLSGTKSSITINEVFTGTYFPTVVPPPADLFDDGDPIMVDATGDTIPAFSVTAAGVAPLVISFVNDEITLEDGLDYTFTWPPAGGSSDRVRVTINATGIGHGTPKVAILECDGPDTGSLTIPSAFIDAFPNITAETLCFGYDCACSSITRYTRGAVDSIADADVELVVGSQVDFLVNHNPG